MIPVAEAIQIVKEQTRSLPVEQVVLAHGMGRFLAEEVVADSDLPPFDRSQMDGYAVRAEDVKTVPARLQIVGESAAGSGWHHQMNVGQAVRIMTGAPVPQGADSVQQVELTRELEGEATVEILESVFLGKSIVKCASEIKKGQTVLPVGQRISAAMMAALASFGYAKVRVTRQPRVAVLATGSELVPIDQQPALDQIRDSNNYSIGAYSQLAGAIVERLSLASDEIGLLKNEILQAAEKSDVLVTSGGVSMGVYDFTKRALKELQAEIFFERVALRPGKPTVFARLPNGTLVFGLPGNPVSVSVTFNLFVRTALLAMQGATDPAMKLEWAILASQVKGTTDRESYLPALLTTNDEGLQLAESLKWGGSSDFVGFARATGLIVVPADTKTMGPKTRVRVMRLPG
ncbi:MAG TPA: gephyrin-like molybdotransferase Glp [Pyrinomonadaceae bacterium]|nr:gephyrin-like molybdotransferase Glp [Pyrinomonadaceae bacterium]